LAHVLHELGAAAGVERIARHLESRIAKGEMRGVHPRFAAEQFILMVVTGPQRRALGLGAPLTAAVLREWIDDTVELFLRGCGGGAASGRQRYRPPGRRSEKAAEDHAAAGAAIQRLCRGHAQERAGCRCADAPGTADPERGRGTETGAAIHRDASRGNEAAR